ncbi:uncharacterized protein LOC133195257 [Saccostrea echinata]|uniref:uncharacterized protein LOC133195257 n=1 Tax=Saccostrea echinata TaxID=191078 RepID=UPI002A81FAF6|nr:uncharacterized protein LOC133195257 [Saccostrea echinata]
MKWRQVVVLYGFVWTLCIASAQRTNTGPEFGFARTLISPDSTDPDPFGTESSFNSLPNLDDLANVPLDFLGGTTMRPPDFSLERIFENITPPDASVNDGLFTSANSFNDILSPDGIVDFQLPPGTNGDVFPVNDSNSTPDISQTRVEPIRPELPDLQSVMSMQSQSSSQQNAAPPSTNQDINPNPLPQNFPPELSVPSGPGAPSSVINDWLSFTSDQTQRPQINNQLITGAGGQNLAGNIGINDNQIAGINDVQHDMWSDNSLFNNPNLGDPSDVFGNMNIPINFPIEENSAPSGIEQQRRLPISSPEMNTNQNRVIQSSIPEITGTSVNRPFLPPFNPQSRIPSGFASGPNWREPPERIPVFQVGGGLPAQQNQINPARRIDPFNEQILIRDVFRDSPTSPQNNRMRPRNLERDNAINSQARMVLSSPMPIARPSRVNIPSPQQIFAGGQQSQQPTRGGLTAFPQSLTARRSPTLSIFQGTPTRPADMQLRPLPRNSFLPSATNIQFRPNPPSPLRVNNRLNSVRTVTRPVPVGNQEAARFITDQRNMNRNMQVWTRIEGRAQNFAGQTSFPGNQIERSNLAFRPPNQFRINQRLPESLLRGLPISRQRQALRSTPSTPIPSQIGSRRLPFRLQGPSPSPLERNRLRISPMQPSITPGLQARQQRREFPIGNRRSTQGGPPFDPVLFLSLQDSFQAPLDYELFDIFEDNPLLFLQDLNLPLTNNLFNPLLEFSGGRLRENRRPRQFPSGQIPNRMVVNIPFNQQTTNNPFGIRQVAPPVSPLLRDENLPFLGSGFFNPRMMMLADITVKPSSKKRVKPVSKQNATQNLLDKVNLQGLRKAEYINTPVVKENRVF